MRPRPLQILAAAAAALTLAATGCGVTTGAAGDRVVLGSGGSAQAEASWVNRAAAQTAEVSSQRVMVSSIAQSGDGSVQIESRADGSFDAAAGRSEMTVEISDSTDTAAGLGTIDLIIDGDDLYLRTQATELMGVDTPWVVLPSELAGDLATSADLGKTASFTLDLLERSGSELTDLGTEEVRGVSTTRLATQIDVAALLAQASPDKAEELRDALAEWESDLGQSLEDLAPVAAEVWVDEQDFIRRVQLTFDGAGLSEQLGVGGFSSVQTVEFYDFNEPVEITVPDPSEVSELDASDLFGN